MKILLILLALAVAGWVTQRLLVIAWCSFLLALIGDDEWIVEYHWREYEDQIYGLRQNDPNSYPPPG